MVFVSAGILLAVWGGLFLPAGSAAGRAGVLEDGSGSQECVSGVWVCCGSRGSGAGRQDQPERPLGHNRGGFPSGQRRQVPEHRLQPRLHTHHSLSTWWLLPPQLGAGTKHTGFSLNLTPQLIKDQTAQGLDLVPGTFSSTSPFLLLRSSVT